MSSEPASPASAAGASSFPTTQWSMVLHAGRGADTSARDALEKLCGRYWYPLYVYVRRQGRPHHEAEDCTQAFFARLLAAEGIARARRERGRFRTFLLTSLRNFLISEWQRSQAEKRGGGRAPISFEIQGADERFALEPVDSGLSPDQGFDRNWAHAMIAAAEAAVREEYEGSGRGPLFAALAPLVWGNAGLESHAGHAARLGLKEPAFAVALHRMRKRIGERLRADVAETVAADADVDVELRHLIAAVSAAPAA
jgi:DNA-directed RNA polymerase specialized sigma24 family protein